MSRFYYPAKHKYLNTFNENRANFIHMPTLPLYKKVARSFKAVWILSVLMDYEYVVVCDISNTQIYKSQF